MKRYLFLFLLIPGLTGCLTLFTVYSTVGAPMRYVVSEQEEEDSIKFTGDFYYSGSIIKHKGKQEVSYEFIICYDDRNWHSIDGKIIIRADEHTITIKDEKPKKDAISGGTQKGLIRASISRAELDLMAQADEITIKYSSVPKTVNEKCLSFFKQFYREYIEEDSEIQE